MKKQASVNLGLASVCKAIKLLQFSVVYIFAGLNICENGLCKIVDVPTNIVKTGSSVWIFRNKLSFLCLGNFFLSFFLVKDIGLLQVATGSLSIVEVSMD